MPHIWDHYEYRVDENFLSAMINGDFSSMTCEECADYENFERVAYGVARVAGFTVGHWTDVEGTDEDWGRCDICNMQAMRITVRLMVYKNEGATQ